VPARPGSMTPTPGAPRAQIGMATRFWAAGMAEPQPLEALRELRWLVATGAGARAPPRPARQPTRPQHHRESGLCCLFSGGAAAPHATPTGPRLPGRHGRPGRLWRAFGTLRPGPAAARRPAAPLPACARAAPRAGTLGAFEAAEVALRLLHALVAGQAAADAGGRPLLPLPRARRELAAPASLPHLAQARPAAPLQARGRAQRGPRPARRAAFALQAAASAGAAALRRGVARVPALRASCSGPPRRRRPRGAPEARRRGGPARLGAPKQRRCARV